MTRYRYDRRRRKQHAVGTSVVIAFLAAMGFAWMLTSGSGSIWPVP